MFEKILERLVEIEGQLDDAMNTLPEYNANVDSLGYIDGARCDLYHLKDEIERKILDEKKSYKKEEVHENVKRDKKNSWSNHPKCI